MWAKGKAKAAKRQAGPANGRESTADEMCPCPGRPS
jgi:hypothetical protein